VTTQDWIALLPHAGLIALLIVLSGFFSGSETALFGLQAIDRERLKEEGGTGHTVLQLLVDPRRTLASVLMGNELVNISLSTVCAGLILGLLGQEFGWVNLLVATPLLILFGEVTPKTVALRNPRRFARMVAKPLTAWAWLIGPVRWVLSAVANGAIRLLGASTKPTRNVLEEDHVRKLVDEGLEAGTIKTMEHDLIHRVFSFSDVQVGRLMTPRPDVVALPLTLPFERLVEQLRAHGFSRIPMYQSNPDDVVGVLLTKDLLRFKGGPPPSSAELRALLQPAYYVPTTKLADDLLRQLRQRRMHMALVVDEHGSIDGLVTLDDLLSELVGSALDEDDETAEVSQIRPDLWEVAASMDVQDLFEQTGLRLPEGDYHTVAGFILDQLGRIPAPGDALEWEHVVFEVTAMDERRITSVRVRVDAKRAQLS
jgi:putative hemolysin